MGIAAVLNERVLLLTQSLFIDGSGKSKHLWIEAVNRVYELELLVYEALSY